MEIYDIVNRMGVIVVLACWIILIYNIFQIVRSLVKKEDKQ